MSFVLVRFLGQLMAVTTRERNLRLPGDSQHGEARARVARYWEIDAMRGVAIGMMVVYHLVYDLDKFGGYAIDATGGFWRWFASATAFLFIFLAGVSLVISSGRASDEPGGIWTQYPRYLRRGLRIFGYGMVISLVTWAADPQRFIKFGILHLIGLGIILGYPFARSSARPLRSARWNVALGLAIIVIGLYLRENRMSFGYPYLYGAGFRPPGVGAFDYRPVLPWFGAMLLGIALGKVLYAHGRRQFRIPELPGAVPAKSLGFLGQRSLLIYFVHQPVLLAILAALGIISLVSLT